MEWQECILLIHFHLKGYTSRKKGGKGNSELNWTTGEKYKQTFFKNMCPSCSGRGRYLPSVVSGQNSPSKQTRQVQFQMAVGNEGTPPIPCNYKSFIVNTQVPAWGLTLPFSDGSALPLFRVKEATHPGRQWSWGKRTGTGSSSEPAPKRLDLNFLL